MKIPRIIATFFPQAWQNDHAIDVDPEGETTFDVTDAVLAMGRERALQLLPTNVESDTLKDSADAPDWIRTWRGPYYIDAVDSIRAYFEAVEAESVATRASRPTA
jgi:hypothetical protein